MPIKFNLRHLEEDDVQLKGELPSEELEMNELDELIHANLPLTYDLTVQKLDQSLLVQGKIGVVLECECARCLKPFPYKIEVEEWAVDLPMEGEERVEVQNDCVDLTPYVREDILLGFPQHPLCRTECGGIAKKKSKKASETKNSSAWAELNKLKF